MLTCPLCMVELANVIALLPEAMRENVLSEVSPTLFLIFDLSIRTTAETIAKAFSG